jgi:hypothetical protein
MNPLHPSTGAGAKGSGPSTGAGSKGVGVNSLNSSSSLPYPPSKEHSPSSSHLKEPSSSPSNSYPSSPSRDRSSSSASYTSFKAHSKEHFKDYSKESSPSSTPSKEHSSNSSKEYSFPPSTYQPSDELQDFLDYKCIPESFHDQKNSHTKTPIFIGFGSMIIEKPKELLRVLLQGAALAGVRVIVQAGWTGITLKEFLEIATEAEVRV